MKEQDQYSIEIVIRKNIKDTDIFNLKKRIREIAMGLYTKKERLTTDLLQSAIKKTQIKDHIIRLQVLKVGSGNDHIQVYCFSLHSETTKHHLYDTMVLPHESFDQLWYTLMFETQLKEKLLNYLNVSLKFEERQVRGLLNEWNKVIFFHGPPGCGKTSLAKALAQQCMIQNIDKYPIGELVEVNAACLGSKYYSESAKQVSSIFQNIIERVKDGIFVFLLIDELESLISSRSSFSGSEPADAVRVVNIFLTELDQLKTYSNVMLFCTSNMPEIIDKAFLSRVDMSISIPPPSLPARYGILKSSLLELFRTGVLSKPTSNAYQAQLKEIAKTTDGLSGRKLRKLFFLVHVAFFSVHLDEIQVDPFLKKTMDYINIDSL